MKYLHKDWYSPIVVVVVAAKSISKVIWRNAADLTVLGRIIFWVRSNYVDTTVVELVIIERTISTSTYNAYMSKFQLNSEKCCKNAMLLEKRIYNTHSSHLQSGSTRIYSFRRCCFVCVVLATKRSASSLAVTFDPPHCYSNKLNATLSVARNHEIIMMIK